MDTLRVQLGGERLENTPSAAIIHIQLRRLGGRAKFLKLPSSMHLHEYAATFHRAATQDGLSDEQRESRVARLRELYESITDWLGSAAR